MKSWLPTPNRPPAPGADAHIWRACLDRDGWPGEDELPDGDRRRASSIQIVGRRRRWVAARWALRTVLGRYTGTDPAGIELEAGVGGKPRTAEATPVRFNLSHSRELALVAITAGREVGVDVESTDPKRPLAYYRSWVRREARAKCFGAGILGPPSGEPIWVSDLDPGPGWAGALALRGYAGAPLRCFELDPPPGG